MAGRLADKVAVITGASSGQGRVAADLFAREGAHLVLADVDMQGLEETRELTRMSEVEPALFSGDLTQEDVNRELMELAVKRYGRVDVLYNVAGLVRFGSVHEISLDDWNFVVSHELTITFLGCKYALQSMMENRSGSIINMSSVSGLYGSPRHAAHAATKAAVAGLTKQMAVDYGPYGIRVNAIAPTQIAYSEGQRRIAAQSVLKEPRGVPLGRHAMPEDTAQCAVYLASDDSSFVSGQILVIDGGTTAWSNA
jgi:NAD(P)-dependent dehydrogenase (short-subunit alcohol dehydrogenase family)